MMKQVLQTESAPKAIGPYSQAIATDTMVFTSGQLGVDIKTGKLAQGVEAQAACALQNLGSILTAQGLTYQNIVKTTVFLTDMADFSAVNAVYQGFFSSEYPARSCVQVAALPMGASVEIECIAIR